MSMNGTPKAIARKAHNQAVARARGELTAALRPHQAAYVEAIKPAQEAFAAAKDAADAAYFEAVGK